MKNEVMQVEDTMPIESMKRQVQVIQRLLKSVLIKDVHYGVIPGCGDKLVLFKAGAEKIAMTFRLAPFYTIQKTDLPNGHREYEIVCELKNIRTGVSMGQGLGSASTMEKKYRYRTGDVLTTDPITKAYWDAKNKNDYGKMKELSAGRHPKKTADGQWFWALPGDKVENEDPADQYNTVLKIAKKRALQDSVITSTACSDLFTQDVDESIDPDEYQNPENEIPNKTPTKQIKKEEALKEKEKFNQRILESAMSTWAGVNDKTNVEAKIYVKQIAKEDFGLQIKELSELDEKEAGLIAQKLVKEAGLK